MYVVADFAAGPVQYGSVKDGDGAVSRAMPVWNGGYGDMAKLVKVVQSAIAHVLAPDLYGQESIRCGGGGGGGGGGNRLTHAPSNSPSCIIPPPHAHSATTSLSPP